MNHLKSLPDELIIKILRYLPKNDRIQLLSSSKLLRRLFNQYILGLKRFTITKVLRRSINPQLIKKLSKVTNDEYCHIGLFTNLKLINFDDKFNRPIDNLPPSTVVVALGYKFNQPLVGLPNLLSIAFNPRYKKQPNGSITIKNSQFNHPLTNLPLSLKLINLGDQFTYPINTLPDQILLAYVGKYYHQPVQHTNLIQLPNHKSTYINKNYVHIPNLLALTMRDIRLLIYYSQIT